MKFNIYLLWLFLIFNAASLYSQTFCSWMDAEEGWNIYKAGTYRYGPSIIVNDDRSIEVWFSASGGIYGEDFVSYAHDLNTTTSAIQIQRYGTVAERFKVDRPFYSFKLRCPTYTQSGQSVTLSVYRWRSTYKATLLQKPLYSTTFTEMVDNGWLECISCEEARKDTTLKFEAGNYLWVLSQPTSNAGIWYFPGRNNKSEHLSNITAYQGTNSVAGSYEMIVFYDYPGSDIGKYWDKITYWRSTDGGHTWSDEAVSLLPTMGRRDHISCCDPGVCCWGEYYYIAYTSTENLSGNDNHVYVARAKTPLGPWEKWNGNGWGGSNVQPVVEYNGTPGKYGAGEPCMVVLNDSLFFYYSWDDAGITTRVAIASADDEFWPAHLKYMGVAMDKTSLGGSDHSDIKYCDALHRFVAIHTSQRWTPNSYMYIWESEDGIHFFKVGRLHGTWQQGIHNCGISGDAQGHLNVDQPQYVIYAYDTGTWSVWDTYIHPLSFSVQRDKLVAPLSSFNNSFGYITDIQGRRIIGKPFPGIIIQNGKKLLIK